MYQKKILFILINLVYINCEANDPTFGGIFGNGEFTDRNIVSRLLDFKNSFVHVFYAQLLRPAP